MKEASGSHAVLLFRLFVPYAVILLASLLVGWFAYHKTSELVESESRERNSAVLGQVRKSLDRRFAEIETIARQMSSESKVLSFQFVKSPFSDTHPYRLWELEKSLFDYQVFNHFIVDYYIAYKNSGMVVSPGKVYTSRQLYDLQLHYEGLSYEDWYKQLFNEFHYKTYMPGTEVKYEGKAYSVVSYMQSFGSRDSQGMITVLIDNKQIQEMLGHIDIEQGGFAYIADQNGRVISQIGDVFPDSNLKALAVREGFSRGQWKGEDMLITQTTSGYNGWTYVAAQPEAVVLRKAHYIKELTLSVFTASLALGLAAAFVLAYRSSTPVIKLQRMLPSADRRGTNRNRLLRLNAMEDIHHSVSALIDSREELRRRLDEQLPLMQNVFFDRLLKGGFTSMEDVENAMDHAKISICGSCHTLAVIRLGGYQAPYNEGMLTELDIVKLAVSDRISGMEPDSLKIHDLGENQLALLLSSHADTEEQCREEVKRRLTRIFDQILSLHQAGITIAVGGQQSRLTEIYRSFGEAIFVQNHAYWGGTEQIIFHDDMKLTVPAYYFPSDVEQRLIQMVKSGNYQETQQLIQMIRDKNNVELQPSLAVERILSQELCGTLLKCRERGQQGPDDMMPEIDTILKAADPRMDPASLIEMVQRALLELCRQNEQRKKSHNDKLAVQLASFIHEHFHDPDLSLAMLAREARTSEAYVSYFFKEHIGLNFSDYLEDIRMNRAKALLAGENRPISEIALSVGYLSLNSFSRAFKRANGVSATEYRRLNQA
ncbi:AraC family transcriptional regulator [Paenibacillus rhizosphaerae]|uniref:AraC family transcriptional regulator n=1 Tax=Paenibacillus rhizosphaerae TaxID=297318 RepID=A0A1R1EZN5_9BACL|nr:AraC family transcriptional regulator [Paenibacillus rhizosphaerae]OMF57289.1 AraC family transcriptional regulator [Paenibacillus rhizosphaerae]